MKFNYKQYDPYTFSHIVASPPCNCYSACLYGWLRREKDGDVFTRKIWEELMKEADKLVLKTLEIIDYLKPDIFIIENPQTSRLKERNMLKDISFCDIDYCRFGFPYRKRTRFWGNHQKTDRLCLKPNCEMMEGNRHKYSVGNSSYKTNLAEIFKDKTRLEQRWSIPPDLIRYLLGSFSQHNLNDN